MALAFAFAFAILALAAAVVGRPLEMAFMGGAGALFVWLDLREKE